MKNGSYPTEVTVVVYSVKNIKPKKKDPGYCVIFSIGSIKYRTDPVQDDGGNPSFNTESVLQVENPKFPLTLVVTEKKEKEFYGQLMIPLDELGTSRSGQVHQKFLAPHKKCSKPTAEIRFEVWISKVLASSVVFSDIQVAADQEQMKKKSQLSNLKKTLVGLVGSPKLSRKLGQKTGRSDSSGGGGLAATRGFSSCLNLSGGLSTLPPANSSATLSNYGEIEINVTEENGRAPKISGISPNSGPAGGGTKVTIRGENLGNRREDIVGLYVCGSNVLASLEFLDPSKILCVTKPWKPGEGVIAMETQSGGKSSSSIKYTFLSDDADPLTSTSVRRSESLKDHMKQMESSAPGYGTPQPVRAASGKKLLANVGFLGIPALSASKSMSNLAAQGTADNNGKTLPSNILLVPGTNKKTGHTIKQPPVIQIQPMRFQDAAPKSNKSNSKLSAPSEYTHVKDLQMQLDGYQMINSELRIKANQLEDENKRLKDYIESLVTKVMTKCPEMLCNNR